MKYGSNSKLIKPLTQSDFTCHATFKGGGFVTPLCLGLTLLHP